MSNYKTMMDTWKDWRLDLIEAKEIMISQVEVRDRIWYGKHGVQYLVLKTGPNVIHMGLVNRGKPGYGGMLFSEKTKLTRKNFDSQIRTNLIKKITRGNNTLWQESKTEGSLPTTVKQVNSPKLKKAKPPTKAKRGKEFIKHHKVHSGPHITGKGAEHATYDFDDSDYDVEGGLQKRKNKQKRGYEPVESINKIETEMYKLIKEVSGTNVGTGLNTGDAWPDGIFTKYGEKRIITPAGMPRGMVQVVTPASDSVYGGDGSQISEPDLGGGTFKRTKITPEYIKSQEVLNPHELRDDTPPLAPQQRVFGRRAFGTSPDYVIPKETHNYIDTAEDVLTKPTTPPEGTKSGGIPSTPEPGSTSKSGYRQLQKGGKNIIKDLDKMYILKMLGQYDSKREGVS